MKKQKFSINKFLRSIALAKLKIESELKTLDREPIHLLEKRLIAAKKYYPEMKEYLQYIFLEVMKASNECDFIIFHPDKKEIPFLQFWVGNKKLQMDFPIVDENNHLKYMKKVRNMLEGFNFTFKEVKINNMQYGYNKYGYEHPDSGNGLNADFGEDAKLTTEFVYRVFAQIFKEDFTKIKFIINTQK